MHEVYLSTVNHGRRFVMDFVRWGMSGAQPRFQVALDGGDGSGVMRGIGIMGENESPLGPTFEASHRKQFTGIGHPDATFIAASRQLVPDLLDLVTSLTEKLAAAEAERERTAALVQAAKAWRAWSRSDGVSLAIVEEQLIDAVDDLAIDACCAGDGEGKR